MLRRHFGSSRDQQARFAAREFKFLSCVSALLGVVRSGDMPANQLIAEATVERVRNEGLTAAAEGVGLAGDSADGMSALGSLFIFITGSPEDAQECTTAEHRRYHGTGPGGSAELMGDRIGGCHGDAAVQSTATP